MCTPCHWRQSVCCGVARRRDRRRQRRPAALQPCSHDCTLQRNGPQPVLAKRMPGDLSEYSVIQTKEPLDREGKVSRIVEFIEKPDQPQTLDSDIMAVGRYVLSADIWPELERTQPGAWGRIQLTDAIAELAKKQSVDAMLMTGDSYDCGKKMGYMQAFVKYGIRNLKEGAKFRKGIEKLLSE